MTLRAASTTLSRSIDDLIAQQPPPMGAQGPYFPRVTNVETFLPLLLRSSAFALAESLVGVGRLTIPREAQVALNIPPLSVSKISSDL